MKAFKRRRFEYTRRAPAFSPILLSIQNLQRREEEYSVFTLHRATMIAMQILQNSLRPIWCAASDTSHKPYRHPPLHLPLSSSLSHHHFLSAPSRFSPHGEYCFKIPDLLSVSMHVFQPDMLFFDSPLAGTFWILFNSHGVLMGFFVVSYIVW